MRNRKILATLTGVVAIFLVVTSVAWACGNMTTADMTLGNATDEPYDGPGNADVGKNWSDCPIGRWLYNPSGAVLPGHSCERPVNVDGKNFVNSDGVVIDSVELYWLDEPFYAAGIGGPNGAPEQQFANICRTKGVRLGTASVSGGKFSAQVQIPPTDQVTADGTPRVGPTDGSVPPLSPLPPNLQGDGKFYYGLNAVCAVWWHPTGVTGHYGSVGNQYSVYYP